MGEDVLLEAHPGVLARQLLLLQLGEPGHELHAQQHRGHVRVGDALEVRGKGEGPPLSDGLALVGHGQEVDDGHVEPHLVIV